MPMKRSALAVLMLGASTVVLHSQGFRASAESGAAPAALFGAPPVPVHAGAERPAAAKPGDQSSVSTSWVLERPKPQGETGLPADASPAVDVSALRYYAQENDLARVAAEIRLLRAKHPGWEPPEDLFTEARGGESEQPLWDFFAKHDLAALQAAIEERRQRTPGWQPSNDLASKLALASAYDALVKASDAKDWGGVLDVAAASRGLMTCANIDALWRTAEALIQTGEEARAVDAYRYVLATCSKPGERLATVQKASALVKSPDALDGLIRMGRRLPGGGSEFDQLRLAGLRQKVGDLAAGKAGATPTQAEIDELAAHARAPDGRGDAELLGWFAYSKKDFAQAETWFRTSLAAGPYAKGAEGLVLALREGGKLPEAVQLAGQYADLDHLNRKLMIEILSGALSDPKAMPFSADQATTLARAVDVEKSAEGAQALGWSRFKAGDLAGAESWFRKSAGWQPNESAAVGLVVTAKRLRHQADYAALVARYRTAYPKVAALEAVMRSADRPVRIIKQAMHVARGHHRRSRQGSGWDQAATAIVKTFEGGNYDQALAMLDTRKAAHRSEPPGLTVVRGWAMYKKGDWDGAQQVFTDVGNKGITQQSMEGLRVIQLGYTNPRFR
jgi:tetratricopeptide (TPR) repeat protein